MVSYKTGGEIAHVCVLTATIIYAVVAVYFTQPGVQGVIDQHWRNDGFCIHNKDVHYWSSFDTCLYVDVFFSLILGILYLKWRKIPGMETASAIVPSIIASTIGHGVVHGAMALKFRDPENAVIGHDGDPEIAPLWSLAIFGAFFWFPLLKAILPKSNNHALAVVSSVITYGQSFCKKELAFAYVQTILNLVIAFSQLMLSAKEKNEREYMLLAISLILPIVVAWSEMLFCDSFFRAAGGHVLYDASIILSILVFYIECHRYHSDKSKSSTSFKEKSL